MQGALEWLGIPYTGSGVLASALAMDKRRTKLVWQASGLPTPPYEILPRERDLSAVAARLGLPLMVKPVCEGSSLGMSKVRAASALDEAYALAVNYDRVVMAEKFIEGTELTVAILGRRGAADHQARDAARFLRLPGEVHRRRHALHHPLRTAAGTRARTAGAFARSVPRCSAAAAGGAST